MDKIVVVGAGFAGIQAALSLCRRGFDVKIIDRSESHVYTPGIIERAGDRCSEDKLKLDLKSFFKNTSVDFFNEEIKQINPEEKTVVGKGEHQYDYLVLGIGGHPIKPDQFEDVIYPYSMSEASKLSKIEGPVAVVGAGYTGMEFATEMASEGLEVTVFDIETRPLKRFSEKVSEKTLDIMFSEDIRFKGGKEIRSIKDRTLQLEEGSEKFENVIVTVGIEENPLIEDCFNDFEVNDGLSVKGYEDIFAVGDCNKKNNDTAHDAIIEGKKIAKNIAKEKHENLETIDPTHQRFIVSMGDTGMYIRKKRVFESRFFRYLKHWVRRFYFWNLKRQAWMLKNLM